MGKNMSEDKKLEAGHEPSDENNDDDFTPKTQDEIRQGVISELGLDDDIDEEVINKLVAKEEKNQKTLSIAIKQKIKTRQEAEEIKAKLEEVGGHFKPKEEPKKEPEKEIDLDAELDKRFEQRDLQSMDVSDEIKKEIQVYAKTNGVTVREAYDSKYIKFRVSEESEQVKNDNASIGRGSGSGRGRKDLNKSLENLDEGDLNEMSDEEYIEWKKNNLK